MKLIILIISIALWSSCNHSCTEEFSFEFPLSVTPKDTFNIGDTIWFEMQSSPKVLDVYSGEYYDLSNLFSFFRMGVQKLDTNYIYSALHYFNIIPLIGQVSNKWGDDLCIEFENQDRRSFKFGLIPTQAGKFGIEMYLPTYIYYLEMGEYKGKRLMLHNSTCNQYMYEFSSVVTNNGSTNSHLLDSVCYQASSTDTLMICYNPNDKVPLSGRGTFAFVVK